MPRFPADEERTAEPDAVDAEPVKQYYEDKKKRYLREMRGAASEMKSGTPFDWEDAARYEAAEASPDESTCEGD